MEMWCEIHHFGRSLHLDGKIPTGADQGCRELTLLSGKSLPPLCWYNKRFGTVFDMYCLRSQISVPTAENVLCGSKLILMQLSSPNRAWCKGAFVKGGYNFCHLPLNFQTMSAFPLILLYQVLYRGANLHAQATLKRFQSAGNIY